MANKTTNYKLTKPLESEFYDVGVQNENMDKIDTQMKANADAIEALQEGQSGKADLVGGKVPEKNAYRGRSRIYCGKHQIGRASCRERV